MTRSDRPLISHYRSSLISNSAEPDWQAWSVVLAKPAKWQVPPDAMPSATPPA